MDAPNTTFLTNSDDNRPTLSLLSRGFVSELIFLGAAYMVTALVASMFIAACGPGCCFVFFSIIAGASGLLMLRQPLLSRYICFGVLLLSLFGMWHEKEVRDTWGQHALRLQIEALQKEIQNSKPK